MRKATTASPGRRKTAKKAVPARTKRVIRKTTTAENMKAVSKLTKKDTILNLLQRDEGATLEELMSATGWQAHSIRGFISGSLRKAIGLTVKRVMREDGVGSYHLDT